MIKRTLAPLLFLSLGPVGAMETPLDNMWDNLPNPLTLQNINNQNDNPDISKKSKRRNVVFGQQVADDQLSEPEQKKRKVELTASRIDISNELKQIDLTENMEMIVETKPSINYEEDLGKMHQCIKDSPESLYFQELDKFSSEKYKNEDKLDYYSNLLAIESSSISENSVKLNLSPQNKIEIITEIQGHLTLLILCTERIKRALELKKIGL